MKKQKQSGGTIIGFIVGVVVGLGSALAVAVYVTKVPVPFMSGKTQASGADHDAAESQKNKDWDPNTPLHGKNPVRPVTPAPEALPEAAPEPLVAAPVPAAVPTAPAVPAAPAVAPPVAVAAKPAASKPEPKPAASADPLGDLAKAKAASPALPAAAEPFEYFVQAGAFRTTEDAEAQRAKLAMMGMEARVTEREQAGRTVYRVRMGPYAKRDDAERAKDKLESAGGDTTLVRVQR